MEINYIVVHCSATPPDRDIGAKTIDKWHKERGWDGIGYHYVIRRDGTIEPGRPLDQSLEPGWQVRQGAHVRGYNGESIGICLIGGVDENGSPVANYTKEQEDALWHLLNVLQRMFPDADIRGHRDFTPDKDCPCFNVKNWILSVKANYPI